MAATKQNTSSKAKGEMGKPGTEYIWQPFSPKSLALINKYNLQTDESYKKLISSFERIESLPKEDPRKPNLVELWEAEFNRLFKHFWENYSSSARKKDQGVGGWKDRLDVKPAATSPDEKRKDLMSRLSPGSNAAGRNSKEEILNRAGYQNQVKVEQFNFTATPKTGQNLHEIENLLNIAEEKGMTTPESILQNGFGTAVGNSVVNMDLIDEETEIMTKEVKPDPNLLDFVNDTKVAAPAASTATPSASATINNNSQNLSNTGYVANENMSRDEFNQLNNIQGELPPAQDADALSVLELGTEFFQSQLGAHEAPSSNNTITGSAPIVYSEKDNLINPEKRNIISKDGFEMHSNADGSLVSGKPNYDSKTGEVIKPYHEIKPVGNYGMSYDFAKRPSMQDLLEAHEREGRALDEMTQKVEFLRDLRNERRHRINMMKIERANSYIVARARRMAEARELKRLKKREELNLKNIEKADRLRRLQERQKLIELMKERQMKRAEEKRVATVLRLERERRLERDAKYRAEIASIDAQIRHEQELIKRTELKMKAYFTRVHDDKLFDESLRVAKKSSQFAALEKKAVQMQEFEEQKRRDRIEKISRKFNKNIKQ
ncbi:hypothetical protein SCHIN_v1c05080 [Spiroplasma chinense]|uniref:Uncharacterized protein n=1 Tax=Spiroplasma chinense TaxID=216932 RepID=A0A5B9Y4H2_9MOLU|nr:hypothetical protein [Spiroplasma chinense]QEH61705.1 hypothetical protein SCHIN_v1c05080 [Spiroplasma chinense]